MDINKMRDLKALAEAATKSHGARRVEVDHNGVHVIGDGSWKILSAWHTPDGKGAQNAEFAAAASPATVLALLAEIERLKSAKGDPVGSFDKHMEYMQENIRLKAENEDYRSGQDRYEQIIDDLKAENEALRSHLQYLVQNEDNHDENQAERHMVITEAKSTLAAMAKEDGQ